MAIADLLKRRTSSPCSLSEKTEGTPTGPAVTGCSPCSPCSPEEKQREQENTQEGAQCPRIPAPLAEIEVIIANLTCPAVSRNLGPELVDLMRCAMRPLSRIARAELAVEIDDCFEQSASVSEAREMAITAIREWAENPEALTTEDWLAWIGERCSLLKDDRKYVAGRVQGLAPARIATVCRWYVQAWGKATAAEPMDHKRDNAGRKVANQTLLRSH